MAHTMKARRTHLTVELSRPLIFRQLGSSMWILYLYTVTADTLNTITMECDASRTNHIHVSNENPSEPYDTLVLCCSSEQFGLCMCYIVVGRQFKVSHADWIWSAMPSLSSVLRCPTHVTRMRNHISKYSHTNPIQSKIFNNAHNSRRQRAAELANSESSLRSRFAYFRSAELLSMSRVQSADSVEYIL